VDARFDLHRTAVTPLIASTAEVPLLVRGTMTLPVASLRGGENQIIEVFKWALDRTRHPQIDQLFSELQFRGAETNGTSSLLFSSAGTLVMRGVTNSVKSTLTIQPDGRNLLRIAGSGSIKLSDFRIRVPPALVDGTRVRIEDDVKVSVECWFERTARLVAAK
jgi:polyisoprenoid-binding protein YceI